MRTVYGGSVAGTTRFDGQVLQDRARAEKAPSDQSVQRTKVSAAVRRINGKRIRFRDLATMAFPDKTEANLSFLAQVDARTVRRWLADDSEPPAEVLGIVLGEIMRCYGRRD